MPQPRAHTMPRSAKYPTQGPTRRHTGAKGCTTHQKTMIGGTKTTKSTAR